MRSPAFPRTFPPRAAPPARRSGSSVFRVVAAAIGAANVQSLSMIASATLWILFMASIALRSFAAVANADEKRPRILSDDELPTYTIIAAVYREANVVSS